MAHYGDSQADHGQFVYYSDIHPTRPGRLPKDAIEGERQSNVDMGLAMRNRALEKRPGGLERLRVIKRGGRP